MIDQEVESLNLLLKSCENKKNQTTGVFIDNLHHPFVLLKESYILPSISIHAIEFNAAMQFLQEVCKHIPEMVAGCHVMPQPKPKKEYGKLFLFK